MSRKRFIISRRLIGVCGSPEHHEALRATGPYQRSGRKVLLSIPVVSPLRPPTWTESRFVVPMPQFTPPEALIEEAYGKKGLQAVRQILPERLDISTYQKHFETLLWVEEEQRRWVEVVTHRAHIIAHYLIYP